MSVEIGQSLLAFLNLRNWILHSYEWKKSNNMMCMHGMGQGQDCCIPDVLSASLFWGSQFGDTFCSLHAPVWLNRLKPVTSSQLFVTRFGPDFTVSLICQAKPLPHFGGSLPSRAARQARSWSKCSWNSQIPGVYSTLQRVARDNFLEFVESMTIPSFVP